MRSMHCFKAIGAVLASFAFGFLCVVLFFELYVEHISVCRAVHTLADSSTPSLSLVAVCQKNCVELVHWDTRSTAILVIDVWDSFFYKEMNEQIAQLAAQVNITLTALRQRGVTIIHCPFNQGKFYKGSQIADRTAKLTRGAYKPLFTTWKQYHPDRQVVPYTLNGTASNTGPTRQSALIHIDHNRDYLITEPKTAFWATKQLLDRLHLDRLLYAGMLDNKCLLDRHNGLLEMAAAGYQVALLHNLSLTGYTADASMSYETAHKRQIAYIQQCVAPTVSVMRPV